MTRMRHLTSLIIAVLLMLTAAPISGGGQASPIQIYVDGLHLQVPTATVESRTLVPLRPIFEALGANVTWDGATQTAHATWEGGGMSLPIGSSQVTIDGRVQALDVPAQVIEGLTMVPLRFVGQSLGAQVGWYGNSRLITINRPAQPLIQATVTRVIDGDTVELRLADDRLERVRLIGMDTPETNHPTLGEQPLGREASDFTRTHLTDRQVLVELDLAERDRYGRLLAYLYRPDGRLFNGVLLDEGYAMLATYPPNVRYSQVFTQLQRGAREAGVGLWAEEAHTEAAGTEEARTEESRTDGLGIHQPSPGPNPQPGPLPEPAPGLKVQNLTSPVSRGGRASVSVQTSPSAQCRITVRYKSGPSKAAGLEPKQADAQGLVSWSWNVGSSTTVGTWPVSITCGEEQIQANFTVR